MKYYLECNIPDYEFNIEIEALRDTEDGLDQIEENIEEYVNLGNGDILDDTIRAAHDCIGEPCSGLISEGSAMDYRRDDAHDYIEDIEDELHVCARMTDDDGNVIEERDIGLRDCLDYKIDYEDWGDEGWWAAQYAALALRNYEEWGDWHIEPGRLWFGVDRWDARYPWLIDETLIGEGKDPGDDEDEDREERDERLRFWFITDRHDFLDAIEYGDTTWYSMECGYDTPDMNAIRERCPIEFTERDTVESLLRKTLEYCAGEK